MTAATHTLSRETRQGLVGTYRAHAREQERLADELIREHGLSTDIARHQTHADRLTQLADDLEATDRFDDGQEL